MRRSRWPELPRGPLDEAACCRQLQALVPPAPAAGCTYLAPRTLWPNCSGCAQRHPQAQMVAGCTDVGLWVTKMHMQFAQVLDVTQVAELRRIERYPHHIAIGAAVSLTDAFAALVPTGPQLQDFANRFAGLPVRNAGTLGGNVANGSPIGDSMPLLIALGAHVVLMSRRGHRDMPLEALYTGYRQERHGADEVLAWIKVPCRCRRQSRVPAVYKISKRFDDDISAVCLAVNLQLAEGRVVSASIGVGGVAATPVRARQTEAALVGQPWSADTARAGRGAARRVPADLGHARQRRLPQRGAGQPAAALLAGKPGRAQINLESLGRVWERRMNGATTRCPLARRARAGRKTLAARPAPPARTKAPVPRWPARHLCRRHAGAAGTLYAAPILSTVAHGSCAASMCRRRWPCRACATWCSRRHSRRPDAGRLRAATNRSSPPTRCSTSARSWAWWWPTR
jgi:CO/xanthine dehydrogenase FAD-binding subunit